MSDYIWHITLTTGHGRRSPRSEVDDSAIAIVSAHLDRALEANSPIPGHPHFNLMATASGPWLLATVMAAAIPLVTVGVAPRSRGAARLWQMLHDRADLLTGPADVPRAPWCAARLERGIIDHMSATQWLADYERALAWAWIERTR